VTTEKLDTLLTALYVHIDDHLPRTRWLGRPPRLTDAELVTLAVAQVLLGFHSEARWIRFARAHLRAMFPNLPRRPAYNKRLRAARPLIQQAVRLLATYCDLWHDPVWITDSTPVEHLAQYGVRLLRPSYRNRTPRAGQGLLKSVRQLIESVNDTLKGQLGLEQHGGRTIEGVAVRVAQRILAMTCAIWHNRTTGTPITRSLIAYDH
jgi:hypothetical protein